MRETKITKKIFDAVTLAAERTSGVINCQDIKTIALGYNFGGAGAATDLFFEVDWYPTEYDADNQTAAVKFKTTGSSGAVLDGTNAIETFEPYQAKRVSGSAVVEELSFPAKWPFCRIRMDGTAGDASDIVTVWACLIKE